MSIELDMNAIRGMYDRKPIGRTMDDIALAAGEGLYPAVARMVEDGELVSYQFKGRTYYVVGPRMKSYRLTKNR